MILLNLLTSQNVLSGLEVKAIEEEAKTSPVPIDEILSEHNVPEVAILTARNAMVYLYLMETEILLILVYTT